MPFAYVGIVALLALAYMTTPALESPMLLLLIVRQAVPLAIAVIGQSLCVRVLSLDLSIGGVILAVSYILTSGIIKYPEPVLLIICILFGACIGALNVFFIVRIKASSVIVTLAMALILSGIVVRSASCGRPATLPLCCVTLARRGGALCRLKLATSC